MDIKYFTPYIMLNQWQFRIPQHQRTHEGTPFETAWMRLPEGVHMVRVLWEGKVRYHLRYRDLGSESYREVRPVVDPSTEKSIMAEIVVPPGGGEIVLWSASLPTEGHVAPPNQIHAGVTVFLGTNESPA